MYIGGWQSGHQRKRWTACKATRPLRDQEYHESGLEVYSGALPSDPVLSVRGWWDRWP